MIRDLAVVMVIAGGAAWLCQRLRLSAIVGYLVAGAVIGRRRVPSTGVEVGAMGISSVPSHAGWLQAVGRDVTTTHVNMATGSPCSRAGGAPARRTGPTSSGSRPLLGART